MPQRRSEPSISVEFLAEIDSGDTSKYPASNDVHRGVWRALVRNPIAASRSGDREPAAVLASPNFADRRPRSSES